MNRPSEYAPQQADSPETSTDRRDFLSKAITLPLLLAPIPGLSATKQSNSDFSEADLQNLCFALAGGAKLTPDTLKAFLAAFRSLGMDKDLRKLSAVLGTVNAEKREAAIKAAGLGKVANDFVATLYSGMAGSGSTLRVVTYPDALAWQALPFTKPNGQCGGAFGYWSQRPA